MRSAELDSESTQAVTISDSSLFFNLGPVGGLRSLAVSQSRGFTLQGLLFPF